MSQQYLTLPSNTTDFTSNTTSSFRVKLPYTFGFNGDWEVALSEMHYPVSWNTIKVDEGTIVISYKHNRVLLPVEVKVQPGFYNDITELTRAINYALEKEGAQLPEKLYIADLVLFKLAKLKKNNRPIFNAWEKLEYSYRELFDQPELLPEPSGPTEGADLERLQKNMENSDRDRKQKLKRNLLSSFIKIQYNYSIKRVEITLDQESIKRISFDSALQFMLGFKRNRILQDETITADYNSDISAGFSSFYVYCSIVEPQCIGNSLEQLLRTVPLTENKLGNVVHKEFISPHYIGLLSKTFDTVEVNIRDDRGEFVDFQFGKVILKLHFRKKSLLNL